MDDVTEIDFEDLTDDTGELSISSEGDDGSDGVFEDIDGGDGSGANSYTITFDGSSNYGISTSSDYAFELSSTGGTGGEGDESTGVSGSGGDGGAAGDVKLTIGNATTFSADTVFYTVVVGGDGGKAGAAKNTASSSAHASDGGDGGDGGAITITVDDGELSSMTANSGSLLYLISQGGDGGEGGKGKDEGINATNVHGGDGGDGGAGGDVTVTLSTTATTSTEDENEPGLRVESLGGAGGKGGKTEGTFSKVASGGDGGSGGAGGTVELTFSGATIKTVGERSIGVLVRSYGGAGGDGGSGHTSDGSGGGSEGGGIGGDVTVDLSASVTTYSDDSSAVLVQSVGGFAGDAGTSTITSYGASDESGGDGGAAMLTLEADGTYSASGDGSHAILVQSLGGGGGKGSSSDGITALGGSGSAGGDGGTATLIVDDGNYISTAGENATAISLMSGGGGGGSGGGADGIKSVGGSGGSGGDGGEISLTLGVATIYTSGLASEGVYASSYGGGGGSAKSTDGITSIGGSGGSGGDGGTVEASLAGTGIQTLGNDASGIVLHSIGGGGGRGSNALDIGVDFSTAVGGSGGDGGSGGTITFDSDSGSIGSIQTSGSRASGLVAQSIGNGGGHGGNDISISAGIVVDVSTGSSGGGGSGGDGGEIDIKHTYFTIDTEGDHAHGILAQSIGNGGGSSGSDINYSGAVGVDVNTTTGGSGGEGGDGAKVQVTANEKITTEGDKAHGILAQSIGGGGGASGTVIAGDSPSAATMTDTVGGSGGKGGDGSSVTVTTKADIGTKGDGSDAILAQSLGGGGGSGGWTSSIDTISGATIDFTTGSSGGDGGDGGRVEVYSQTGATISTTGDNSAGINTQSIGGGGGDGNITVSGDLLSGAQLSLTTGGSGGDGGDGGNIIIVTDGMIETEGANSVGILSQSLGNTGGNTSFAMSANTLNAGSLSANVSGNGGDGGSSGTITIDNGAGITTEGYNSSGIIAQSIAGGGGNTTGSIDVDALTMSELSVSVGGSGGEGGKSEEVKVSNTGDINTSGVASYGILAQSIGGDGGNGGYSIDGGFTAGTYTGDITISASGDGGSGNESGLAFVSNTGDITTEDYQARGIYVQSIGGSGGNAHATLSGTLSASSESSLTMDYSISGDGGDGGTGGDAEVKNYGNVTTKWHYADAIAVQSIGGDGGSGGSSFVVTGDGSAEGSVAVSVAVGGSGGSGSVGGDVSVLNASTLTTSGNSSSGIYSQSIGGNGGQGGSAGTFLVDLTSGSSSSLAISADVSIGGEGGTGSDGGEVTAENYGDIYVSGIASRGIFSQSVGGGGGDGGSAAAYSYNSILGSSSSNASTFSVSFSLGGDGGAGGDGGIVKATNTETISSSGIAGYGIFAQSVGGGGGNGGDGALGATAFVDDVYDAIEAGDTDSAKSAFQDFLYTSKSIADEAFTWYSDISDVTSISSVLDSFSVAIGGAGGASGDGGDVTVTNSGDITTTGSSGTAIYAQSVGGGGGAGGDGSSGLLTDATVGGGGSGGGDGGTIYIDHTGTIKTTGAGAMGMFVQSIGGGGGAAGDVELGFSESVLDLSSTFGLGVATQEDAGDGGDGGDITIESGAITTTGKQSHGIWAQSLGGGGGAAGLADVDDPFTFAGNSGDEGKGGKIEITLNDAMSLSGDYSTGIFAQSLGGSDSDGGEIVITLNADLSSSGTGGWGIVAQSDGYDSGGAVYINVESGVTLSTGSSTVEGNAAIYAIFGGGVSIKNAGTITNLYAGDAIVSETKVNITNSGTIYGNFDLKDSVANSVINESTGVLEPGSTFDIGTSGTFYNSGTLSPGGENNIINTDVTGAFDQDTTDGTLLFDAELQAGDEAGEMDLLKFQDTNLSDKTWYLTGTLDVNVTSDSLMSSGDSGTVGFAEVYDLVNTVDISGLTVTDTATVDYEISTEYDDYLALLSYTVDYTSDSIEFSSNQQTAGDHLDTLISERKSEVAASTASSAASSLEASALSASSLDGSTSAGAPAAGFANRYAFIQPIAARIMNLKTAEELKAAYDQLAPGDVFAATDAALYASLRFSGQLASDCSGNGGQSVALSEPGACAWLKVGANHHRREGGSNAIDYVETALGTAGGVRIPFAGDWYGGTAFAYEDVAQSNRNSNSKGFRLQGGGLLGYAFGATDVSASLSGGYGSYRFRRDTFEANGTGLATAHPDLWWGAAHVMLAHEFALSEAFSIKPSMDVGATYTLQPSFNESGQGDTHLRVSEIENTVYSFNPGLDLTSAFLMNGLKSKATLHTGLLALAGDTDQSATAQFAAVTRNGPKFGLVDEGEHLFAELGVSFETEIREGFSFQASVDSLLSTESQNLSGSARLNFAF
ncbi:autotransporter outer membrane beta-barrel domain-containing protein [uncultured Roseibium sp.]|uniref:autotransporter outer membrane beta-barrel domain-containing protein n=1 Tax=uncultured Roseibium sp. TaxID=1936171 RepID=UPI003216490A